MTAATLFILAVGLSMDAFAVSISNGMCYRNIGLKQALATAVTFGIFQGGMPILGYFGGRLAEDLISSLDHWIALVLLGFIGGSMILESMKESGVSKDSCVTKTMGVKDLAVQGLATSIDALAVGISLAALKTDIVAAAGFITVITFGVCLAGVFLGKRFGDFLGGKAKICGGLILIGIGVKIFVDHMFFS